MTAGLCHTDLFGRSAGFGPGFHPVILGHEGAGVGDGVTAVAPGDHVVTVKPVLLMPAGERV